MDPDRVARAARAIRDGDAHVEGVGKGTYRVRSFTTDETYTVALTPTPTCTCPDARFGGTEVCKHIGAVALLRGLGGA